MGRALQRMLCGPLVQTSAAEGLHIGLPFQTVMQIGIRVVPRAPGSARSSAA